MLHVSECDNGILRLVCYISDPRSDSRGVPSIVSAVGEVTILFVVSQVENYVLSQAGNLVGTLGPLVDPSRPQKQHRRDRSFLKEKKKFDTS